MNILIISPIFSPTSGGASIYYMELVKNISEYKEVKRIFVITEKINKKENYSNYKKLSVINLFPFRSGKFTYKYMQFFLYGLQNLQYLLFPIIFKKLKPDVTLLHSSFLNYPNLLYLIIKFFLKKYKIILDVRDCLLPKKKFYQINLFRIIITCSETVNNYLPNYEGKRFIPIFFNTTFINDKTVINKYRLGNEKYFLYCGLIKKSKNIEFLYKVFKTYQIKYDPSVKLVLVGINKDNSILHHLLKDKNILYFNQMPYKDILSLIFNSYLPINLSLSEGLSRFSLESLFLKKITILPRNIIEFNNQCSSYVAVSYVNADLVADQIFFLKNNNIIEHYNFSCHDPKNIRKKYFKLFMDVIHES